MKFILRIQNIFQLSIPFRYPADEKFEYWCGAFEVFKWAWVQYLAASFPVYLFLAWVRGVLFRNRVFAQVVVEDAPRSARQLAGFGVKPRDDCGFPTVMG